MSRRDSDPPDYDPREYVCRNYYPGTDAYTFDRELELYPFVPGPPHGTGAFELQDGDFGIPRNPVPRGQVRGFDTDLSKYSETKAKIRFEEPIHIRDEGTQIFRCTVVDAPKEDQPSCCPLTMSPGENSDVKVPTSRSLVAKVYDFRDYDGSYDGMDDGLFTREFAAYSFYYANNKTGHPHAMPQFYGGWVMKLENIYKKNFVYDAKFPKFRYVCLILIEYINGRSIEHMCFREEDDPGYIAPLTPIPRKVMFHRADGSVNWVRFGKKDRQLVMKKMLYGLAVGNHLGVEHNFCHPSKVFITMLDGNTDLDELRVVFLDHDRTEVWRDTRMAKTEGINALTLLPYPRHPYHRYGYDQLDEFHGWWPPLDKDDGVDMHREFTEWLCSEEVFGPVQEAEDVMAELEATGKDWPYPYPKFSKHETLQRVLGPEERKKRERRKAQRRMDNQAAEASFQNVMRLLMGEKGNTITMIE